MSDDIIAVGTPLPRIAHAVPLDGRKIKVVWADGSIKVVDLSGALASRRIYIPLRDNDDLFRSLHVAEYGDGIEWNGELDFSALWLDRLPEAEFTNEEFRKAMDMLKLSNEGMAADLEISRSQVAEYKKDKPIPRHIALATRYLLRRSAA
jgi:hypothetical protein